MRDLDAFARHCALCCTIGTRGKQPLHVIIGKLRAIGLHFDREVSRSGFQTEGRRRQIGPNAAQSCFSRIKQGQIG